MVTAEVALEVAALAAVERVVVALAVVAMAEVTVAAVTVVEMVVVVAAARKGLSHRRTTGYGQYTSHCRYMRP